MKKGIVIAGATGVGKTALSIKLAQKLDAVIISSDSAQVYKEMDIGTAKITKNEMKGIKHYMLDVLEPTRKYSVGDYEKQVNDILNFLSKSDKNIILTGGTGLYINAITEGLSKLPGADEKLREEFMKKTPEELFLKLKELDPQAAKNIHPNNKKRIERALEVCLITGGKFSELSKKNIKNNNYDFLKIALERDRDHLYNRINLRVDMMIKDGLFEEVKKLYFKYGDILKNINIIGYSEFIEFIKGEITYDEAIYNIKKNSRHYAKRQFTWFKNDNTYIWYNLDKMSEDEIIEDIMTKLKL